MFYFLFVSLFELISLKMIKFHIRPDCSFLTGSSLGVERQKKGKEKVGKKNKNILSLPGSSVSEFLTLL